MDRARVKMGLIVPQDEATDQDSEAATTLLAEPSQEDKLALLLQQFEATQRLLASMGAGRIAADGSFILGRQLEMRKQRDALGSDCTCDECTPYNQRHWVCFMCGSGPWEWHTRAPRTQRTLLAPGNKAGIRHAVCSDRCGRDYLEGLGRVPSGEPPVPQVPIEHLPRSGDDGEGFLSLQ